ncbi:heterokaryon incompatibility protein-domain-containing protein [Leptodontidium sp. MPI-SDFR-AT-0119]|nr:heterokaryon incompatibility protein-domain-containing protein [Leptodontidium sp. MPI-SDFR-AT-0119]
MELFKRSKLYRPLRKSDIRVVKFRPYLPALDNLHRIEARLYHVSLDTATDFFALSYVWGDPNSTRTISLDGRDFPVTNNLWWAITYIRNRFSANRKPHDKILSQLNIDHTGGSDQGWEDYAICWWIDAICINQADLVEKSKQVPRMKRLYSTATRVAVWLGHVDDELSDPFTAQIVLAAEKLYDRIAETSTGIQMFDVSPDTKVKILSEVVESPGALIRPMRRILDSGKQWSSRIWTLQEGVLAREDPAVMIGKEVTSLLRLGLLQSSIAAAIKTGVYNKYVLRHDSSILHTANFQNISALAARLSGSIRKSTGTPEKSESRLSQFKARFTRQIYPWGNEADSSHAEFNLLQFGQELLERLALFSIRQATVPHDRIYGLLGLTSLPDLPKSLVPDYGRPFGEVCFDYTKYLIQSTNSLHVLSFGVNRLDGSPTWVPDFTGALLVPPSGTICNPVISSDGKCLTVMGVNIGHAIAIHSDATLRAMDPKEMPSHASILSAWADFATSILLPASQIRRCDPEVILKEWSSEAFETAFGGRIEDIMSLKIVFFNGGKIPDSWDQQALACVPALSTLFQFSTHLLLENGTICHWFHQYTSISRNEAAAIGDVVCGLRGTIRPTLLRPRHDGSGYGVVGNCWPYPISDNTFTEDYFQNKVEQEFPLF